MDSLSNQCLGLERLLGLSDIAEKTVGRIVAYALCAILFSTIASAQSLPERWGLNSLFGISPSTQDFVNQVSLNEMLEIGLSMLAEQRGGEKARKFAAIMLEDHKQTSSQLKALIRSGSVRVSFPTILDGVRQSALDKMRELSGPDFDREFESLQVEIHNATLSLFERYGADGDHPDLKSFAVRHLPHLNEHWRLARDLKG